MPPAPELEFVLVSSDYATMTAVSGGVKQYGAKFLLVPTVDAARDCLSRRKIDGVFVDMTVSGALELIEAIRNGPTNPRAVIFACILAGEETRGVFDVGANFLLRKPLGVEGVTSHIKSANQLLVRERRRYFRHPVNLLVSLKTLVTEQRAKMTNLSEGGMAIRTSKPLMQSTGVEFEFELPDGVNLSGRGQVAWTSSEGMAGIMFQHFHGDGQKELLAWITARERVSFETSAPEGAR